MENTALQLSDLKVSNLPELQGWKEKQEQLVTDNPYIEITDNKTYEIACKSRTALLKGRTELEKQDKLVASKLASFRKDVKTETDILIAITLPFEEKQQVEVKRYEGIKEAERLERDRVEQERVERIKSKIDSIETDSLAIIQKMTFQTVIPDGTAVALICKEKFDFEEYDILFEQTLARIENAVKDKIDDLNEREEQRVAREQAEEENRKLKAKQDLQAERLKLFAPYIHLITEEDEWSITDLADISEPLFNVLLSSKQFLFEQMEKKKQEAQEKLDAENLERENKAKADKEKIFDIRRERLAEIGMARGFDKFINADDVLEIPVELVENADAIQFEEILNNAKKAIEKAKAEYEEAEKQKDIDEQLSKDDAERLKKENKARVAKYAKDKKALTEFVKSLQFTGVVPELQNPEVKSLLDNSLLELENLRGFLLTNINLF